MQLCFRVGEEFFEDMEMIGYAGRVKTLEELADILKKFRLSLPLTRDKWGHFQDQNLYTGNHAFRIFRADNWTWRFGWQATLTDIELSTLNELLK